METPAPTIKSERLATVVIVPSLGSKRLTTVPPSAGIGERVEGASPEREGPRVPLRVAAEDRLADDLAGRLVDLADGGVGTEGAAGVVAGRRAARGEEGEEIARARPRELRRADAGPERGHDIER